MLIGNLWLRRTHRPLPVHPKLNFAVWWVCASSFPTTCSLLSLCIVHTFRIDWIVVYVVLGQTHAKLYIVNRKIAIIDGTISKAKPKRKVNQRKMSTNDNVQLKKCRTNEWICSPFAMNGADDLHVFGHLGYPMFPLHISLLKWKTIFPLK